MQTISLGDEWVYCLLGYSTQCNFSGTLRDPADRNTFVVIRGYFGDMLLSMIYVAVTSQGGQLKGLGRQWSVHMTMPVETSVCNVLLICDMYIYIDIDIDIYIWHEITQTNKLVVLCRTNDRFVWIINNRHIYQYTTGRRFHSIRGYNMRLSTVNSLLWCITDVFNICLEIDWCAGISYVGCCDIDIKKFDSIPPDITPDMDVSRRYQVQRDVLGEGRRFRIVFYYG